MQLSHDLYFRAPSADEWDEILESCAREVRSLGRRKTSLDRPARELAHSLEELVGLHGWVSIDYATSLIEQASRFTLAAESGLAAGAPTSGRGRVHAKVTAMPPAYDAAAFDELAFDDEATSPATPSAFAQRRSGVMERTRGHGLRFRAG